MLRMRYFATVLARRSVVSLHILNPWVSLTVGFVLLIGDQASDQDWVLNLPKTKDKGA